VQQQEVRFARFACSSGPIFPGFSFSVASFFSVAGEFSMPIFLQLFFISG
jgi:hypothetical protein